MRFLHQKDGQTYPSSVTIWIPYLGSFHHAAAELLLYEKERYMYEKVLPLMYAFFPSEKLSPDLYTSTEFGVLILENLRESGYYPAGYTLLDRSMSELVFRSLARFHTLSLLLPHEVYTDLDLLTITNRSDRVVERNITLALLKKFKKHVIPSLSRSARKLVNDMIGSHQSGSVIDSAYSPNANGLNVLLYGDSNWQNMYLQNDSENRAIRCKFVDFGNSRRGSPAIDLINLLMIAVEFDVFRAHRDLLFSLYMVEVGRVLKEIAGRSRDPPPHHQYGPPELRADIEKYRHYFIYRLVFNVPLIWQRYASVGLNEEEDVYDDLFRSEKYISFFLSWLEVL
jgi:hypothetical protein